MQFLALLIIMYAVKSAIEDTRSGWRKSKAAYMHSADARFPSMPKRRRMRHAARHDAGYWAGQAAHGFPATRHGLVTGWHAGRLAQTEGRAAREKAKTEHLEARAAAIPEITSFRQRQQKALREIRAAQAPQLWRDITPAREEAGEGREGNGAGSSSSQQDGAVGDAPAREKPTYSFGPADNRLGWPMDDPDEAHSRAAIMSEGGKPWVVTEYPPGGGPGTNVAGYLDGKALPAEEIPPIPPARSPDEDETYGRMRDLIREHVRPDAFTGGPVQDEAATSGSGELDSAQAEEWLLETDRNREFVCDCGAPLPRPSETEDVTCQSCGNVWEHDGTDRDGARLKVPESGPLSVPCPSCSAPPGGNCTGSGFCASRERAAANAVPQDRQEQSPTEGEPSMTTPAADVTYDGVLRDMAAASADAEGRAAEQRQASQQASGMSEQMQVLDVDPATLSAMADHLDAHDAATRAQQRVQETAETVEAALRRGHAGLNEAHQNAPVQAADRGFYAG